jgi:hypothetical protein
MFPDYYDEKGHFSNLVRLIPSPTLLKLLTFPTGLPHGIGIADKSTDRVRPTNT